MGVVVVTPPDPIVTLAEAKAHLRVEHSDDDVTITAQIAAVTGWIDGPDGWLGRALGEQELELRVDAFCTRIALPFPPVISVDEVTYVDGDGDSQIVAAEIYAVVGVGTNRPSLVLAYGSSWPTAQTQEEAVIVAYTAGYETVPAAIRQAILLLVGHWYENREAVAVGVAPAVMPFAVDSLLSNFYVRPI